MPIVLTISLVRAFGVNKERNFQVPSLSGEVKSGSRVLGP